MSNININCVCGPEKKDDDDCDDEINADLLELVERYQPTVVASIKEYDVAQYEQLTIEDCFPEIFN